MIKKTNIAVMITGHTRNHYDYWMNHVYPLLLEIPNSQITLFFQLWNNNTFPDFVKDNELVLKHYPAEYETKTKEEIRDSNFNVLLLNQYNVSEIVRKISKKYSSINHYFPKIVSNFKTEKDKLLYFSDGINLSNYFSQPYSWSMVYKEITKYESQNNMTFDHIIKLRYDCFFSNNFKNAIIDFEKISADFLFPGCGVWQNFEFKILENNNVLCNGLHDQFFIVKQSEKTKLIFDNLLDAMILQAFLSLNITTKKPRFEQCLHRSLLSLDASITTVYYDFFINRNVSDFNKNFNNFINGKFINQYSDPEGIILLNNFYNILKNRFTDSTDQT